MHRDFTHDNLGVRVYDTDCTVIERKPGVVGWVEAGQRYAFPLPVGFDSVRSIPPNRLAVAFNAYDSHNPGNGLRELLTQQTRHRDSL